MQPPLKMAFRPPGISPKPQDFRCMHFDNWTQIAEYLDFLQKPLKTLPWVLEGDVMRQPDHVIARASDHRRRP